MTKYGKILFFNESDGRGIIITSEKEKIDFLIQEWNDYDIMPSIGLEVIFNLHNKTAVDIVSKNKDSVIPKIQEIEENESIESLPNTNELLQNHTSTIAPTEVIEDLYVEETLEQNISNLNDANSLNHNIKTYEQSQVLENSFLKEEQTVRPDSIAISINISTAISNYFKIIKNTIDQRNVYNKVNGSLDYILIKRFLFTTYNNLSDIDLEVITPKIKTLYKDLKIMSTLYKDFIEKTKYPNLAFHEVFLSYQTEYMKIKIGAEYTIERLNKLRTEEEKLHNILKVKKEDLAQDIKSDEFDILKNELKSLNGAYIDTVHLMAELDEMYKYDMKLLNTFEKEYRNDFKEKFITESHFYKNDLVKILNAQAYLLDSYLWTEAKKSKNIKAHFKGLLVQNELNTKTYLKYYLDTLNSDKATGDTKKLFELYNYLVKIQKEHIIIIANSSQDAMEYEHSIKNFKFEYEIKAFISEKNALKWAITNNVKIIVIEDKLQNMSAETFLKAYKKHISTTPYIIFIGEKPKTDIYQITYLLPKNVTAKVIADNIKSIVGNKK